MTQINAAATLAPISVADTEGVYVLSNGSIAAFFKNGGVHKYAVSTDSGATWSAAITPPVPTTLTFWDTQIWPGIDNAACIVQTGDVIDAYWVGNFNAYGSATALYLFSLLWNTSTNRFVLNPGTTGPTGVGLQGFFGGGQPGGPILSSLVSACTDGAGNRHAVVVAADDLYLFFSGVANSHPIQAFAYFKGAVYDVHLRYVAGTSAPAQFLLSFTDKNRGQITVIPVSWTASLGFLSGYNVPGYTPERAYGFSGTDIGHTPFIDSSGKLNLIIRDGTNLYAVKRTGAGSYSAAVPLYSSVAQSGSRGVAVSYNAANDDVYVAFESVINQPNGEIFMSKRAAGVWGSPTVLAGGSSAGFSAVLSGKAIASGFAPAILQDGAGVDYAGIAASGAPFTPTVTRPVGYITTLTPTMSAPYVNPSPSDPIGFQQWQVQRVSDSSVFLDSGKVVTTTGTLLYAGTALVYGTQYQARVKFWDSISAAGAGLPSGFSAWSPFTPIHGPVGTITSIVAGGATIGSSPGTLVAPTLVVHFTYTQADGDSANSYRLKMYAADGVTLLQASAPVPGAIAPAGTITTFSTYFSALANSTVYFIAVETTDAVTGLATDGPQWQLTTAWTPPTTPSAYTVTAHPDLGTVTGAFTNDGTAVTNNVYALLPGGAWVLYKSGSLFTTFTARPNPQIAVAYRVTALGVTGIESAPADLTVTLGLRGNAWGVWLTDITNPALTVAVGAPASWSDMALAAQKDRDAYSPLGGVYQKSKRGVQYWQQGSMKFWIPGAYILTNGSIALGQADVDVLKAMDRGTPYLHYRDPNGITMIVEMYAFSAAPDEGSIGFNVAFGLDEMATVSPALGTNLALLIT